MCNTNTTFLHHYGGEEKNSFVKIVNAEINMEDDVNEVQIFNQSSYYDYENFLKLAQKCKNKFSIFSSNIQSVSAKFDFLKIFIERLRNENFEFSVICLQETWLSENDCANSFELDGYKLLSQGKVSSSKGGLFTYVNNKYDSVIKSKLNSYQSWEGLLVKINKGNHLSKPVIVGNIYRPPRETVDKYKEFITEFSPILKSFEKSNNEIALAGDYNVNSLKVNQKDIVGEYFDNMTCHSFYPHITYPTRFSRNNCSLIDNIWCKLSDISLDSTSGILIDKFSDHQPYFTIFNGIGTYERPPAFVTIHTQNEESIKKFEPEIVILL